MAMYGCCKSTRAPSPQWVGFCLIPQVFLLSNRHSLGSFSPSFKGISRAKILGASYPRDRLRRYSDTVCLSYRWDDEEVAAESERASFEVGVFLFNAREYYRCHDVFETLWNQAEEPQRTLLHGLLQCCVGLYHLFNQNHRGAMVELGEGLSKLQKLEFGSGPFQQFEQDTSTVLEFIYNTQLERAACTDEYCLTMDGSEQSYQLLGNFGAGKLMYDLQRDSNNELFIYFSEGLSNPENPVRVRVPILRATEEHLKDCAKY
eukprot:Gb_09049 [translate_table: standard]